MRLFIEFIPHTYEVVKNNSTGVELENFVLQECIENPVTIND